MSGSGGFFKYRCKYFYTHDCPNWVFVNYAPCAECCAAGRDEPDSDEALSERQVLLFQLGAAAAGGAPVRPGLDINIPVFRQGFLCYNRARVAVRAAPGAPFVDWELMESIGSAAAGVGGSGDSHRDSQAVGPSPHQPLLHQHVAAPYGDHDYGDASNGVDIAHHYSMFGDGGDEHLHAKYMSRPSPLAQPLWQQQQQQQQQQQYQYQYQHQMHPDEHYGPPPPYNGYFNNPNGLRF